VLRRIEISTFALFTWIALSCVFTSAALADQVTLKNGDHLTGTVVKGDGKTIVLHTDAMGDITIQFAAVQEIKTDKDLHIGVKGGKTEVGTVTATDGKIEVATKTSGTVEVVPADVTVIRNDAEQTAFDKSLHPGLLHGWTGGANVGFSVARGNSETENLALAFNAVHASLNDKLTLYATSIDTNNNLATPSTVANLETGGLRFDRNLNPKLFAFGAADFMSNALQFLDLRQVYTGGFGYHAIKSDKTVLDFLGGVNYTHETYSNGTEIPPTPPSTTPTGVFESYGVTHRYVALTLGEELMHKLGKSTVVTQNVDFYPNLQDTGQYRFTFNMGTVTKINKWLGWQNQFGDIYVSNPPTGSKTNDVLFTTGLNIAFTH
jgi:putative salt-induced outer membrane protein